MIFARKARAISCRNAYILRAFSFDNFFYSFQLGAHPVHVLPNICKFCLVLLLEFFVIKIVGVSQSIVINVLTRYLLVAGTKRSFQIVVGTFALQK